MNIAKGNTGGGMTGDDATARRAAADMLEAFASVGASRFDVTWTNIEGAKQLYRGGVSMHELRRFMPQALTRAIEQQRNLIVRPHPPPVFLQLDDMSDEALRRVEPVAFLTLDTSPGNHQAWLALSGHVSADFARRVRKGAGADPTASGATRVAGSLNFKEKYRPNFPRVAIGSMTPGRTVTPAELEAMGMVAPLDPVRPARPLPPARPGENRRWPSYRRCLDGAPPNHANTGPDMSRADFTWCKIAADWGWTAEEIADRLSAESPKARENGEAYATLTATRAAQASARGRGPARPTLPSLKQ